MNFTISVKTAQSRKNQGKSRKFNNNWEKSYKIGKIGEKFERTKSTHFCANRDDTCETIMIKHLISK